MKLTQKLALIPILALTAFATMAATVRCNWNPNPANEGIQLYVVEWRTPASPTWNTTNVVASTTGPQAVEIPLALGGTWQFRASASNAAGMGPWTPTNVVVFPSQMTGFKVTVTLDFSQP